jgi:hypothetical protein
MVFLTIMLKALCVTGLAVFSLLFCYLGYEESTVWPRASWTRSADTPEYVHERYQRSYFSLENAERMRRLHNEEAVVLLAFIACWVALARSRSKSRR